ncbi:chromate efflux transporter [Steroidobacter flavus]|uniref:Chromate efflux transporter n=1 Tax=Steroidobacter flavus TaxID=1842136 RepID=A0ABV8T1I5_9GAMM
MAANQGRARVTADHSAAPASVDRSQASQETLTALFLRFLKLGAMAWGGPVAQIAMLRRMLVDDERWVSSEHFNRILALYQVLPGPEAHEMCVHFGTLARGRIGGVLAGVGFMLPGFVLMFLLSWVYFHSGLDLHGDLSLLFSAVQAAVIALIVRAVHRIGSHVLLDPWLWAIGAGSLAGQLSGVHFAVLLAAGGLIYSLRQSSRWLVQAMLSLCLAGLAGSFLVHGALDSSPLVDAATALEPVSTSVEQVSLATLFWSGLKAGLLTFGGAYTVIPFLQRDAVSQGAWMSNAQFMDGIALSGLLPAPLIIFSTFVGFAGGGPMGAVILTAAIFLPAFAFPLLAHGPLDRLLHEPRIREFLDGLTAAVVGLIAGTVVVLLVTAVRSTYTAAVFAGALALLFWSKHKLAVPLVVAGAATVGAIAIAIR